jgi:glycosyltransferase involved in cell wall biosynthesis
VPGPVITVPGASRNGSGAAAKLSSLVVAQQIARLSRGAIQAADIVHIHSNGLIAEVGAAVAGWYRKPIVLTLYGTEIWHYRKRRLGPDLFTRAYRSAAHVTFYSQGLSHHAQLLGLARRDTTVVYPPVADHFQYHDAGEQAAARAALGIRNRHLLVNVKRLHPLAGQRFLIEAMNEIVRTHPDTRLVICGTGPLAETLKDQSRASGVEGHVTFAGLVENRTIARYCAAADLFVLPSLLEACPTVAVEALACGTPVIGAENPGSLELNDLFGHDVSLVPAEQALPLARTIAEFLAQKRRTLPATTGIIEKNFRPSAVAAQFREIYQHVLSAHQGASS